MADDSDSLLREVEQELRRERLEKFWNQYSGLIVAGVAALVIGVGGYSYYYTSQQAAAQKAGVDFIKALDIEDGDAKAAEKLAAFEAIAKSGAPGYSALARLHVAGTQVRDGKKDEALATFNALAGDTSADPLIRDFAKLQAASVELGTADFTDIKNRLTPLAASGAPYENMANELLGVAAFRAGKLEEARGYLEPVLIDPAASQPVQDRIKIILGEIAAMELAQAGDKASKSTESPETKQEGQASSTAPANEETKPASEPAATDKK